MAQVRATDGSGDIKVESGLTPEEARVTAAEMNDLADEHTRMATFTDQKRDMVYYTVGASE